jgi:hypothetical protein
MQRLLWRESTIERVRKCRRVPNGSVVELGRRADGAAQFSGLTTCASIHACPRCANRIWAARGSELAQALDQWHALGFSVGMVTLTMRHSHRDALADLWDGLSSAWASASTQNRSVRDLREKLNVAGFVRTVETTYGAPEEAGNGWHIHIHALVFFELPPAKAKGAVTALGRVMFEGWKRRLVGKGFAAPLRDQGGLDARALDLNQAREAVGKYVTKATFERAAFEMTGTTGKKARYGNITPWGLLHRFLDTGEARHLERWKEYERASTGRRAMTWSHELRKRLVSEPEPTDEELAADEAAAEVLPMAYIGKKDWAKVCTIRNAPARLLEAAEAAADQIDGWLEAAELFRLWGIPPPDLPPPELAS